MQSNLTQPRRSLNLDHVAHFLPHMANASSALIELGFTLAPFSEQSHKLEPDAPLLPAGTANRCVMLRSGYLEFLTPTHDTPNAQQLHTALARYTGVHLIAFGTSAPQADFAHLTAQGFAALAPLALQRTVTTGNADATARFTVVRVAPTAMAEGRVQYCQQHTPEVVWQTRWLAHANHAVGLAGVLICVADPAEAAQRYARFTGLPVQQTGNSWRLDTARGYLLFANTATVQQAFGVMAPAVPWIAGYVIDSDDMNATRALIAGAALGERMLVRLPDALGGLMIFQAAGAQALNLQ